jgi:hypothetical protein
MADHDSKDTVLSADGGGGRCYQVIERSLGGPRGADDLYAGPNLVTVSRHLEDVHV